MNENYGALTDIVATAGSIMSAVAALYLTWRGRAKWEPTEQDIPKGAQKVGGVVTAVAISVIWYWFWYKSPDQGAALTGLAIYLAVATLISLLSYGFLVALLTYDEVVAVGPNKTISRKIIGGFLLTPQAKKLVKKGMTVQRALQAASYEADVVWPRPWRAFAKTVFVLVYVILVASGTSALTAAAIMISDKQVPSSTLPQVMENWLKESEAARAAKTASGGGPLPTLLTKARSAFEASWQDAGLAERRGLDQAKVSKALSYMIRTYRLQEKDSPTQKNAIYWADIAIRHFEETQDSARLTGALLDKAAIFLDQSQLGHNNKDDFTRISAAGDAVITRAVEIADADVKPEALRISSRFYYNLARPRSFRLSDAWDNTYLLLAYSKAEQARKLAPDDIKNANQMVRVAMKVSKNPPQDSDRQWGIKLRESKNAMKSAWDKNKERLSTIDQRLSPLNVLGTATLEIVAREWHDASPKDRADRAKALLTELEADGLASLREAEALLQNAELKRSYGFDIRYDIARCYAQRVMTLRTFDKLQADKEFGEVKANLVLARSLATSIQTDAALKDVRSDLSFSKLAPQEKAELVKVLQFGAK